MPVIAQRGVQRLLDIADEPYFGEVVAPASDKTGILDVENVLNEVLDLTSKAVFILFPSIRKLAESRRGVGTKVVGKTDA